MEESQLSNDSKVEMAQSRPLNTDYREGDLILGEQLQNPYTIQNMTAAYAAVNQAGVGSNNPVDIRITHYYVKFKPENFFSTKRWQMIQR